MTNLEATLTLAQREAKLRAAIESNPDAPALHAWLGHLLLKQQRQGEAESALRRAVELGADAPQALVDLCTVLRNRGRVAEAIQTIRDNCRIHGDKGPWLAKLGEMLDVTGDFIGADEALARAVELEPKSARMHELRSMLFARHRRYDEALVHMERAAKLEPRAERFAPQVKSLRHLCDRLASSHSVTIKPATGAGSSARRDYVDGVLKSIREGAAHGTSTRDAPMRAEHPRTSAPEPLTKRLAHKVLRWLRM